MAFWNSGFGASMNTQPAPVALILDRDSFTLEDLLDEDEILQECNSRDADERLIAFLSRTDTVRKLAEYIVRTVPPAEPGLSGDAKDHDDRIRVKFPFIASEIFQSTIPPLHAELLRWDEDGNDCLEILFSLLEREPPIDAVLAGYFRSVIMSIVHVDYGKLVQFVQAHPQTIDNIIKHIGSTSILEVLIVLGWDDAGPAEEGSDGVGAEPTPAEEPQGDRSDWMADMGVVEKLVAKLSSKEGADENHSASYALVDVVAKCASHQSIKLLERLQAVATVEQILGHVIGGNENSFCEGLGVLIALVHKHANEEFDLERAMREERADRLDPMHGQQEQGGGPGAAALGFQPSTAAAASSPSAAADTAASAASAAASAATGAGTAAAVASGEEDGSLSTLPLAPSTAAEDDTQLMYKAFSAEEPYFVRALTKRLPDFEKVLFGDVAGATDADAEPAITGSASTNPRNPLGARRLKVVEMLVALLRTHYPEVMGMVASLRVIPECLSLFFEYKWNNILHGYVEHIVQMIISGPSEELKRCLFERGELVDRVLRARSEHDAHVAERNHFRAGFMGHLTRMCNTIVGTREHDEILAVLTDRDDWRQFVQGPLNEENSRLNVVLGGVRPEHMIDATGMDIHLNLPSLAGLSGGVAASGNAYQDASQMQHGGSNGMQDGSWDSDSDEDEDDDEGAWSSGVYFSSEQSQQLEPRRVGDSQQHQTPQQQSGEPLAASITAGGGAAGGGGREGAQAAMGQGDGAYPAKYSDWSSDFPANSQWDTPEQQQGAPADADSDAAAAAAAAASRPRGNSRDLAWDDEEEDDFHEDWRESLSDGSPGVLSPAHGNPNSSSGAQNAAAAAAAVGGVADEGLGVDPELEARAGARKPSPNASASELMAAASRVLEDDDFDAAFPDEPTSQVAPAAPASFVAPESVEHVEAVQLKTSSG